jgi:Cu+-exporting ATPase
MSTHFETQACCHTSSDHKNTQKPETDLVCGMSVKPDETNFKTSYKDKTYYFCSLGCVEQFKAKPVDYIKKPNIKEKSNQGLYTCPMHPEIEQTGPGACPKCGMALESMQPQASTQQTQWTCPMHPEIIRDEPGNCPICGMALEPQTITLEDEDNPELKDMTRRFVVSAVLAGIVVGLAMIQHVPGVSLPNTNWVELTLSTPVVLWGGWPFFQRGWASILNRHLNMFTLIALGTGVAFSPLPLRMLMEWWVSISKPQQRLRPLSCWAKCWN